MANDNEFPTEEFPRPQSKEGDTEVTEAFTEEEFRTTFETGTAYGSTSGTPVTAAFAPAGASAVPPRPTSPVVDGAKGPYPRKMLVAAFVLGIVGTSLAAIALIVGIAGFGGHGARSDRGYDRGDVTISKETITERGHGGRVEFREFNEEMTEEFGGGRGGMRERVLEEQLEMDIQSS